MAYSISPKIKADRVLYESLFDIWHKVDSGVTGQLRKLEIDKFWNANKFDANLIKSKIEELNSKFKRRQKSVYDFFGNPKVPLNAPSKVSKIVLNLIPSTGESKQVTSGAAENAPEAESCDAKRPKLCETKVQDEIRKKIDSLNTKVIGLKAVKSAGMATDEQIKQLSECVECMKKEEIHLKKLQLTQLRQQRFREKRKQALKNLKESEPDVYDRIIAKVGEHPGTRGQPSLTEKQPLLLKTIVDIVSPFASAHERRRTDMLRSCSTLDDLQKALIDFGFNLSRSAVYLRLLPRRSDTREGQRHKTTVPVKLIKATNDARSAHMDSHFCAATVKYLKNLADVLGPDAVFALSQDDKARVPLGITAAAKQAPILMHLDYKIKLQDHDFPKSTRHKLIPLVYAGLLLHCGNGYSGPTYIAIRSGKHDKSCAASHAADFRELFTLSNFQTTSQFMGSPKPVVLVLTDGGPDENPRFEGTLYNMVNHFKEFNFDALFVACYAPGQSAYNPVERRMATLSKDLSGVVLPHDSFGSHLQGVKTVDKDLEIRNFNKAGNVLSEIWNNTMIDNFEVLARYIEPVGMLNEVPRPSEDWLVKHVRQSQYLLQIIKCDNTSCCSSPKTNVKTLLGGSFMPGPVAFIKSSCGLRSCNPGTIEEGTFFDLFKRLAFRKLEPRFNSSHVLPFDYYCPSVKDKLQERSCCVCQVYFCSKKPMLAHKKSCHKASASHIEDIIECVVQGYADSDGEDSDIEVIESIPDWLKSPFVECEAEATN